MAFPTSPTNGQTYTVNGIVYVYSSAKTAWQIQSSGSATVPTTTGGNLAVGGNLTVSTNASITGTMSVTGNANVGNIGTATAIITTGNITTLNSGLIQNGNSNVSITANGAVAIASNGLVRATVDTSGRLQLPYQPCFRAHRPLGNNTTYNAGNTIVFNTANFNIGNHFNTSTYQFTAPIAGLYLFTFIGFNNMSTAADRRVSFYINGSTTANYQVSLASSPISLTQVFRLSANDTVDVRSKSAGVILYEAAEHTEFSGYLIG